ncbi:RNA polymerase sigma factor SigM [Rhodococcus sp. D2-41]|uniref:RNA polymerase sigma factor SigM n=1 Tax=Speluncibacter jeojiensis TaxID=2710754 RepID=A0A9X4M505_9ACTN|nr:RNA polymerase sigma factor SigM [Rhodococcus sp. D2-41]MDG3009815.1 RNA polymerase sigma factor SigM [Rhodococcus sp. D2-41]MDG3014566.1 RNA polymerase sigma factor SigM [Corynebacteriales bacterium D3-21]
MRLIGGQAEGPPSDADLLAAHVRGDRYAFAELMARHQDHLWQVARRTSYSTEDAADALQEAMLSAHRSAANFRADAAVRSWLHRIVVNACLDRIRRNKARPQVTELVADGGRDEPVDVRNRYDEFDTAMLIEQALVTLPPEQRAAIVAVDVEGLGVAEAARLLGVAEGTVKSRRSRARLRLAEALGHLKEARE